MDTRGAYKMRQSVISILFLIFLSTAFMACNRKKIVNDMQLTTSPVQFEKMEFEISLKAPFVNPFDSRDIALDMVLIAPSGRSLILPCFFDAGKSKASTWKAHFTPQEAGDYTYHFSLVRKDADIENTLDKSFRAAASDKDGFLHINDFWTLKFDSGKLFRGIGENVGWEARDDEDARYTYDYLLPSLANNGANFFRCWMCPWNLPLEWKKVSAKKRYTDSNEYFNPSGIKRMDEFITLVESLGLHIMLALDSHNALIVKNQWETNNYNIVNGGPAATPAEFFTLDEAKAKYKNRLRYLVARWGYSTAIAAWEFFNEIDNAVFTSSPENKEIIPPAVVTAWHNEMSLYLKSIDPFHHIVTTSVSHRDIAGMNDLPGIDLNQKHIYKRTDQIGPEIIANAQAHNKPYVIGEFAYEWDWNLDFKTIATELDFDYKRGLWYGLFSPTPIVPMTWWWEFFDERKMTPYFKSVREISDRMLAAGKGSFEISPVSAEGLEAYAVRCGTTTFAYLLNNSNAKVTTTILFPKITTRIKSVQSFRPADLSYKELQDTTLADDGFVVSNISLNAKNEILLLLSTQ
jgi:hypothetical protein